jgi:hypothetical protein
MKVANYSPILATLLAVAALPSAAKLAPAPLSVLLSLTDDLASIKANVTNLGAEVSSGVALFEFYRLIPPSRTST